jgi:hypothetical protein
MEWHRPVNTVWLVCALFIAGGAGARPSELLKQMCIREERLGHLAVACYVLGRGRGWDCHPVHLRRTSMNELRAGYRLRQVPPECRSQIARELERRRYLMTAKEDPPIPGLSDMLIHRTPTLWQEN